MACAVYGNIDGLPLRHPEKFGHKIGDYLGCLDFLVDPLDLFLDSPALFVKPFTLLHYGVRFGFSVSGDWVLVGGCGLQTLEFLDFFVDIIVFIH